MSDRERENPARDAAVISRRQAVIGFGALSLTAALDLSPRQLERALDQMAALVERPEAAQQPHAPKFFTPAEWRTVRLLSDYVIPRDARSGSATDAKVPEYLDFLMSDKEASESSKVSMRGGIAWMDREAQQRFNRAFVAATDAQRREILDDIAFPAKSVPAVSQGVAFFTRFRDLTASGFFSSQMGWKDLQYIGNVSNPGWDGCPPAAMARLGVHHDLMKQRGDR